MTFNKLLDACDFLAEIRCIIAELRKQRQPDDRLDTEGKRSLYDNCGHDIEFALALYSVIKQNATYNFRNNGMRKRMLLSAITQAIIDHRKAGKLDPEQILSIVVANEEF